VHEDTVEIDSLQVQAATDRRFSSRYLSLLYQHTTPPLLPATTSSQVTTNNTMSEEAKNPDGAEPITIRVRDQVRICLDVLVAMRLAVRLTEHMSVFGARHRYPPYRSYRSFSHVGCGNVPTHSASLLLSCCLVDTVCMICFIGCRSLAFSRFCLYIPFHS
jgi:hypothetical protein